MLAGQWLAAIEYSMGLLQMWGELSATAAA